MISGVVLIDKSTGMTSHDVVAKLRRQLGEKKIGHAGTLDPLATGLLVMGIGSGTKLLHHLFGLDKQYQASIRLGESTTTDDRDGEVTSSASALDISRDQIEEGIKNLTGKIKQIPSSVSAIKLDGKRAYDLVREGKQVEIPARAVEIYHFRLTSELRESGNCLEFDVEVDCTSGTYIRALARDLGAALGVGGHIRELRRSRIGNFTVKNANRVENLIEVMTLLSVAEQIFAPIELSFEQARDIIHGKRISVTGSGVLAASYEGHLLAIIEPVGSAYRSVTVFPEAFHG